LDCTELERAIGTWGRVERLVKNFSVCGKRKVMKDLGGGETAKSGVEGFWRKKLLLKREGKNERE